MKRNLSYISIFMLLFATMFSAGISAVDDWSMFHHDMQHVGYSTSTAPDTNNILWAFQTGDGVSSSPAVVDGRVYIGSDDNKVYCLDALTGEKIWEFETGDYVQSSPTVVDDKVYIGSNDKNIYCLYASNGTKIWNTTTSRWSTWELSSPAVYNDKVYIGSYCLYSSNGTVIWSGVLGGNVIYASPAVADGRVFSGSDISNRIYCLDAEVNDDGTTEELWSYQTNGMTRSTPAIYNGKIYVGSYDHKLYCLNALNGSEVWNFEAYYAIMSSPAVSNGKVFFGSLGSMNSAFFYCVDAENGNEIWSYQIDYWIESSPAIYDGKVYIGARDGKVYCFRAQNPPEVPNLPDGQTDGEIGEEYSFTTNSVIDPEGDDILYLFDWGDGTDSGWISTSSASHSWNIEKTYEIKVKAKDTYDESDWSDTLTINVTTQSSMLEQFVIIVDSTIIEENSFTVLVKDDADAIVEGADVMFNGETKQTDTALGQVEFTAPSVEVISYYTLLVSKEGYESYTASITVLNQNEELGWIWGLVYDDSGNPVEDAKICAIPDGSTSSECMFTNKDGQFIKSLSPGTYTIKASIYGYKTSFETVTILENKAIGLNFKLEKILISDKEGGMTEYVINDQIINGNIGAEINAAVEDSPVILYTDDIAINIDSAGSLAEGDVSFTVSGEGPNTILVIYINTRNPDSVNLKYDNDLIDRTLDIVPFFSSDNTIESWVMLPTATEGIYVVFFNVPQLSEHTITISSVVEIISGITAVIFYIAFCTIAGILFLSHALSGPVLRFIVKGRKK